MLTLIWCSGKQGASVPGTICTQEQQTVAMVHTETGETRRRRHLATGGMQYETAAKFRSAIY